MKYTIDINADFKCLHCGHHISANAFLAGVNNRNHCPYCLWSRHLDWYQAGDRLSACKAGMRPVGLTLKRGRNKYACVADGELMLVHQCIECEKLSINRIAADDVPEALIEVFDASTGLPLWIQDKIQTNGINLLGRADSDQVYRQLYGQLNPTIPELYTI